MYFLDAQLTCYLLLHSYIYDGNLRGKDSHTTNERFLLLPQLGTQMLLLNICINIKEYRLAICCVEAIYMIHDTIINIILIANVY